MPADPQYDEVHTLAKPVSPHYGCHNRERPAADQMVVSGNMSWPYRFTTNCQYDMKQKDKRCAECKHVDVPYSLPLLTGA